MNREIEQGLQQESTTQRPEIPTVTRDSRGRILWKLPGNTSEQNEQLGIANIQALFLEKFPEFEELFPRGEDGKIEEEKKQKAKEYILDKIKSVKDFTSIIGRSVPFRISTPYFNGSYITTLQKSFAPWDVQLSGVDLKPERRIWTEEKIMEEARKFFEENGALTQTVLNASKRHDLVGAIGKYPGKMFALKEKLGIKQQKIPYSQWTPEKIREEARKFVDREGRLSQYSLAKNKQSGLASVIGLHYPGGFRKLREDLGLEEFRKQEGYWTPENIEKEALGILSSEGEFSNAVLRRLKRYDLMTAIQTSYPGKTEGLGRKIGVRSEKKHNGYYTQEQMKKDAQEFLSNHGDFNVELLIQDRQTGFLAAVGKYYPRGMVGLRSELGLAQSGKPMGYWTPENIEKEALEFYRKEKILTTTILKEKGSPLATLISSKYPGGMNALKKKLDIELSAYPEGYWSVDRIEQEVRDFCKETSYISEYFLEKGGRTDLAYAIRTYYPGGLKTLRSNLKLEVPNRTMWTVEKIEEEAKQFLEIHGKISHSLLIKSKNGRLSGAIVKHYPGSFVALRKKLGISLGKSGEVAYVSPDQANEALMKLLEDENE